MKAKTLKNQKKRLPPKQREVAAPFIEHLHELRKRLFYCSISIGIFGTAAYFVQQKLVNALLWPTHGQQFIYTSVGGGISFLFKLCIYVGIAISLPVITYQILRYLQPLLRFETRRFVFLASLACGILAICGMAFGYYIGLPAALHFLLHQFSTRQIHALLTIQEYMSFVTAYLLGSAMLFQIPLILMFVNRIKPLKPRQLIHYERWVILGAFVASGLMNPTPQIVSQLALAGPIIIMYQVGIIIIWRINGRRKRSPKVREMLTKDAETQALRLQTAAHSITEPLLEAATTTATTLGMQQHSMPTPVEPIVVPEPTPIVAISEQQSAPMFNYRTARRIYADEIRPRTPRMVQ